MTCVFYFKTVTLIPFLLHYYHVTFSHVTPHMTHSNHLLLTWSPLLSFLTWLTVSLVSYYFIFDVPTWVPLTLVIVCFTYYLWLTVIPYESLYCPLMTLLGIPVFMTPYYYTAHLLLLYCALILRHSSVVLKSSILGTSSPRLDFFSCTMVPSQF